jgi:lysozyme
MNLIDQLRRDEGVRYTPYPDSRGFMTIGVGHKILPTENFSTVVPLSDGQVDMLLGQDIDDKQQQLAQFPWFLPLNDARQGAITNMAFNLGVQGLLHFPSMIHYLTISDWMNASAQALESVWATQVGDRAKRIAQQILTGEWV